MRCRHSRILRSAVVVQAPYVDSLGGILHFSAKPSILTKGCPNCSALLAPRDPRAALLRGQVTVS